jgi:hypothetical protein
MHFHLPKPLHGWRAFAGEVGIIVVGVLIALAAEQLVEAWRWHQRVAVVRKSIMDELTNNRARWEVDVAEIRCALSEIDGLVSWARTGGAADPPSTSAIRSANLFSMHSANWGLAANSQTLDHFPMREQLAFAALYAGLSNRDVDIQKVADLSDRVHTLVPLASDPAGRRELRETLGDLRSEIGSLTDNEDYMERHFDALSVKADPSDFGADLKTAICAT